MAIIVEDKGVLGAMLDEGEEFLKKYAVLPENMSEIENVTKKIAKLINGITDKAAELIEEYDFDEPTLDFSVVLPKRYYDIVEGLNSLSDSILEKHDPLSEKQPIHSL